MADATAQTSGLRAETTMNAETDRSHRWRMTIECDAETPEDLAAKLADLAHDLWAGRTPAQSVFASPSCAGIATITPPSAVLSNPKETE